MSSSPTNFPSDFSAQDRFLAEKTEEALVRGVELQAWRDGPKPGLRVFPLDLAKKFKLENRAEGYFGETNIAGRPRSVMGAKQFVKFGRLDRANAAEMLKEFVYKEFLTRAHWMYPDGYPGGFTVEQSIYMTTDGVLGTFGPEQSAGCIDWRTLGSEPESGKYKWVLLTLQIHDFVMEMGPVKKRLKEAACVAPSPRFMKIRETPNDDCVLSIQVGYPFVEFAPIPNIFGFGPGKFGIALKYFTFNLMKDGEVTTEMDFLAAPRCEKVFDFGKMIPDPLYGTADMVEMLTLGMVSASPFHDMMDKGMLETHCRVHQALMDGLGDVWVTWLAEQAG